MQLTQEKFMFVSKPGNHMSGHFPHGLRSERRGSEDRLPCSVVMPRRVVGRDRLTFMERQFQAWVAVLVRGRGLAKVAC